jgi:hypothetical protein
MASTRDDLDMADVKEVLAFFPVLRQRFSIVQVYTTLIEEFLGFVRVTAVTVSAVTIESLPCTNKAVVSSRFAFDADSNLYGVRVCMRKSCALSYSEGGHRDLDGRNSFSEILNSHITTSAARIVL